MSWNQPGKTWAEYEAGRGKIKWAAVKMKTKIVCSKNKEAKKKE